MCEKPKAGYARIIDPNSKAVKFVKCDAAAKDGGSAVVGCMKCAVTGTATKCLECAAGKYLKPNADPKKAPTCASCTLANCAFCPGDKCKRCKDTHYEDSTSGTLKCSACSTDMKCSKCDAYKGCFACAAKFSLVSNSTGKFTKRMMCKDCSKVTADCEMCTASKCLGCKSTHALSEDGKTCT